MKFLIITQDLRVSGTSQGIIERSFLGKMRRAYPESIIDVLYLSGHSTNDNLEILPVDSLKRKIISSRIPFHIKWISRITYRFFNVLYAENYLHEKYAVEISRVDRTKYDHIMVRSAGLNHEVILAMHKLPILKHSIINFHDPYPNSWYSGNPDKITKRELLRLKKMIEVVNFAKGCCASAYYMAKDLQYLYASDKFFYTLPHQFDSSVFDLSDTTKVREKKQRIQISYHGALMFGRNILVLVEAFKQLIDEEVWIKEDVEFVLRVKGEGLDKLKEIANSIDNIVVLDTLDFSNSSNEQINESDVTVILENGPYYSNILGGKVPFLFALNKHVLISSPKRSELKKIFKDYKYTYDMNNIKEAKEKLREILTLSEVLVQNEISYFSDDFFKQSTDTIFNTSHF